jgi:23S rRNA pseudouridine2605 synthase
LTAEQLQAARAAHWHQIANPLLTLDDAATWLDQTGLCVFLPRQTQLPAPAPSFVEACLGETNATPPLATIEAANGLVTRLVSNRTVVPLNLLGVYSEQPDFLASIEVLPYLLSLRGDRDWK